MEFRYPAQVTIGSTVFVLTYDYDREFGANFRYAEGNRGAVINFGMKNHKTNPLMFLELLIHEFKEILQVEQNRRVMCGDGTFEFHYGHAEHSDLCGRLAGVLSNFIK